MYNMLILFLVLFGMFILFIGGVIMVDFWFKYWGVYLKLIDVLILVFNWVGLGVYVIGSGCVYFLLLLLLVIGVLVVVMAYLIFWKWIEMSVLKIVSN